MLDRKKLRGILLFALYLFYGSGLLAQSWKEYSDSAKIFRDQNKVDLAIEYYIRAKELLPKDSFSTDTYIGLATTIGNLYFNGKGQYVKAEPYFLQAREIIKMKIWLLPFAFWLFLINKVFIRKKITNKRGNYSFVKLKIDFLQRSLACILNF